LSLLCLYNILGSINQVCFSRFLEGVGSSVRLAGAVATYPGTSPML